MNLNEEQKLAVEHPLDHPAVVMAGAGSGKTTVLTQRLAWLMDVKEQNPKKLLALTFTNKAARELVDRLSLREEHERPRVTTIHSLALSAIRRNPVGFGLSEKITPIDDYNQKQIIKKVIEEQNLVEEVKEWDLLEKIGYHRARGIGFKVDYTKEVHEKALVAYGGQRAISSDELSVWAGYEKYKQKISVVDFDDMLHLVTRRGREDEKWRNNLQKMFHHVLMDESQDTSVVQWELINLLIGPTNKNLYCVGDLSQCQPPGTKIKVVTNPTFNGHRGGNGKARAIVVKKNIEDLTNQDKVISWNKHDQISYSAGKSIEVGKRYYSGPLYSICTDEGVTKCTPNHWNWVRFNKNSHGKYAVYLMWRPDMGFRIGLTVFKRSTGVSGRGSYGLTSRMVQEKAERGWILRICETRQEAEAWEEAYSVKFGIPESVFECGPCRNKTQEQIRLIFSHANPCGGLKCLEEHGLLFDYPIVTLGQGASWRGWFKTATANIFPVIMDIPLEGRNKSTPIVGKTVEHYEGLVYSLEVEDYHTYIADGLVVGNSIYSFNGSSPELLYNYTKEWRGIVPTLYKLEKNHRSVPEVVALANKTQRLMTEVVPIQMKSYRGEQGEKGNILLRVAGTPKEIAYSMSEDILRRHEDEEESFKDTAILVRAGSQVRDIETELVRNRIPYIVRGAMGLMQTEEVKDMLSYMRIMVNPKDYFAMLRSIAIPKRGVGDAVLEKVKKKADEEFDGNLLRAAMVGNPIKFGMYLSLVDSLLCAKDDPITVLNLIIKMTGYEKILKTKYKKDPDKVEVKLANLERLKEVIVNLTTMNQLTTEDVVFQLTMQDQKDEDDGGRVTISTIHAAKGLEWPNVYVAGVYEGSLPHKFSSSPEEIQEERRVFYVACTRAKNRLILCVPGMVEYFNKGSVFVSPSRFLSEIGVMK